MSRFRHKREAGDEAEPRRRRHRKPFLLAAIAGVGAWFVAKSRRSSDEVSDTSA